MPRVTYTAQIEDITGKLGGSIFKRVKAGPILRRGQTGRQPHSAKQQQTRGLYNTYSAKWFALTETQREMWNKFASLSPDRLTGYNAFLQHNIRIRKASHADLTEIETPPPFPSTPHYVASLEAWPDTSQNTIVWTAPTDVNTWVQVFFAVEVGFSFKNKEKWSLVETVRADVAQVIHTHAYPTEIPILYRARTIDAYGRVSPFTHSTYGATIGAHYGEDHYEGGFYA